MRLVLGPLVLFLLVIAPGSAAAQTPPPSFCASYPCPPCERAEPVCEPTDPTRVRIGRLFDFLGTPDPNGPFGGGGPLVEDCRCECVWGSSPTASPTGLCEEPPPVTDEDPFCSLDHPYLDDLPGECNPLYCDPAFDDIPASSWTDPLTGQPIAPPHPPGVSPQCLAARADEYWPQCFAEPNPFANAQNAAKAMELLVQLHPGGAAQAACEAQPGAAGRCQDGIYCGAAGSQAAECVRCTDAGECYRYRSLGGVASSPPEEEVNDQLGLIEYRYYDDDSSACATVGNVEKCLEGSRTFLHESAEERREQLKRALLLEHGYDYWADVDADDPLAFDEPIPDPDPYAPPTASNDRRKCLVEGGCRDEERSSSEKITNPAPGGIAGRLGDQIGTAAEPALIDDPVAIGSGALVDTVIDLAIDAAPGSELGVEVARSYSSEGNRQGVLGRNWAHAYEERIVAVNELYPGVVDVPYYCVAALPVVRCAVREVGAGRELFTQDPVTLAFVPGPGTHASMVRGTDASTGNHGWILREAHGEESIFDSDGRLRARRDRNRNTLRFRYDADGRLAVVGDPLQRLVRFAYTADGLLERVTDFTGRTVEYGYELVPPRTQLPESLQAAAGITRETIPGLFVVQWRLISVVRTAPATADAPARTEVWSYKWHPWDDLPPPPAFYAPPRELCAEAPDGYRERLEYELMVDELLGNLVKVWGPDGDPLMYTEYQTDPTQPDFDRVRWQRYGADVELATTPAATYEYRRDPATFPSAAASWVSGTGLRVASPGDGNCHDLWQRHANRSLVPAAAAAAMAAWDVAAFLRGEPTMSRVDVAELELDLNTVCQLTLHTDRRGHPTWYGVNFTGQLLIAAKRVGTRDVVTTNEVDVHGHVVAERSPTGRTIRRTYDGASPSPLARGNLLDETETPSDGTSPRTRSWIHEPLFNTPMLSRDALGRDTYRILDYQELGYAEGEQLVLGVLRTFGASASTIGQIAPSFWFIGSDLNADGRTTRSGNVVYLWAPPAMTASGLLQLHYASMTYNDLGQLVWEYRPLDGSIRYTYFPAQTPHGGPVETTAAYLHELSATRRNARQTAGGYLSGVHRHLVQTESASALGLAANHQTGVLFERNLGGRVTVERDLHGSEQRYGYDGFGQVVRTVDPEGYQTRYAYSDARRLAAVAEGIEHGPVSIDGAEPARRTRLRWDAEGRLAMRCEELRPGACAAPGAEGTIVTSYHHDAEGNLERVVDPEGHVSSTLSDERGLPLFVSAGGGLEPRWLEYDDEGNLISERNALWELTSYEYDGFARLSAVRPPDGSLHRTVRDLADNVRSEQVLDGSGAELSYRRFEVDEQDRVYEIGERWTVPAGQLTQPGWVPELITRLELDEYGNPTQITRPDGAVEHRSWTWAGDLVAETDAAGNRAYHYLDPSTRRTITRAIGEGSDVISETEHDRRGLPIRAIERSADGAQQVVESARYDGLGLAIETTDGMGTARALEHDWLGRLVRTLEPRFEDGPLDLVTRYRHDRRGLVTELLDPSGVATVRAYGASGRLVRQTSGRQETTIDHDPAGNAQRITRAGSQLHIWRSGGGQSTSIWEWDNAQQSWTSGRYLLADALGRLTYGYAYQSDGGVWSSTITERIYDSRGGLLTEQTNIDGRAWHQVRYGRDATGATRTTESPDGSVVSTDLDPIGRPVVIESGLGRFELGWRGGALVSISNGIYERGSAFDGLGRAFATGTYVPRQSAVPFDEVRALDVLGRARDQEQRWNGVASRSRNRSFEYGATGWLTAHTQDGLRATLDRDKSGTLLAETVPGEVRFEAGTMRPDGHEYDWAALGGVDLDVAYDLEGRVISDLTASYEWNGFDHLTAATVRDTGERWRYLHDVLGRRVARITPSGAYETFAYDGWNRIATYRNGALVQSAVFGPLADQPLAVMQDMPYYPVSDLQGNVVAVLDEAGDVYEQTEYDAFGGAIVHTATGSCTDASTTSCQPLLGFGYNGQLRDPETGLYYYKHRSYNPRLRSFMSRDPLGFVDAFDPWLYAGGDSINATDPLGLEASDWVSAGDMAGNVFDVAQEIATKTKRQKHTRQFVKAIFDGTTNEYLRTKRKLRGLDKVGKGFGILGAFDFGLSTGKAIKNPTTETITDAVIDGVGTFGGPVGAGIEITYAVLKYGDNKFKWSDSIADDLYSGSDREKRDERYQDLYWNSSSLSDREMAVQIRKRFNEDPAAAELWLLAELAGDRTARARRKHPSEAVPSDAVHMPGMEGSKPQKVRPRKGTPRRVPNKPTSSGPKG